MKTVGCCARGKSGGTACYNAYLEDYSYLADGLLALYQATFDDRWFEWAQTLAVLMLTTFLTKNGGFFDTSAESRSVGTSAENDTGQRNTQPQRRWRHACFCNSICTPVTTITSIRQRMIAALGNGWRNIRPDLPIGWAMPGYCWENHAKSR